MIRIKPIYIRDLSGNEYTCQATITQDYELNGNQSLSAVILPSKVNRNFIDVLSEMWGIIDFDGVEHRIVYVKKRGEGESLSVEIKAVPAFFDDFNTLRIYDEYDEHMTAQRCFSMIFEDTPYSVIINGSFNAVEWQGLGGGETRLEMLKRALDRYHAEFRIVGNTVYIENLIGRDTQFQYRYRLNASNINKEHDATALWTFARGYGDYEDSGEGGEGGGWESANLLREYTSPLAQIIGVRHAPPIKDGRIRDKTTMDRALKELVDESLKISIEADIHDLRRQGYPLAQPELGDRVFVIDERIGLDEEVRVVSMQVKRNWRGEVIDLNLTFGTEGVTKRYQSGITSAIRNVENILSGNIKLPYSVLDDAVLRATEALRRAESELSFSDNGILAVDKNNPNYLTLFNSAGLGVSRDGGASFENAITGRGINASTIWTGHMLADRISGGILRSLNDNFYLNMNTGKLEMLNANFELGGGAVIRFTDPRNNLTYTYGARRAGIGFGNSVGDRAIVFVGHTRSSDPFTARDESLFRGLVANAATSSGDVVNTLVGPRTRIRNNIGDFEAGYEFRTTSTTATLRPLTNAMTSNIGTSDYPINNVRADDFYGTLNNTSTYNAKINLEEVCGRKAFDYIEQMKIKSFYYINDDYTNPFNRKVSPIIEQLDPVLENLYKSDNDNLDLNSNIFLIARAFQYYVEKTDSRLEVLENAGA